MTETDLRAHPWPPEGKNKEFRFRPGIWVHAVPDYNRDNKKRTLADMVLFLILKGKYPFFTWNNRIIHGYIGWKPVPVETDPAFFWRDLDAVKREMGQGQLWLQLSFRPFGIGKIS